MGGAGEGVGRGKGKVVKDGRGLAAIRQGKNEIFFSLFP